MNIKKSEDGFSAESAEVIGILVLESEPESISIDPLRGEMRDFCRRNIINEGFRGKAGTSLVMAVADKKVKSVVICGIGKDDSSCEDRVREAMFKVVRSAAEKGYSSIAANVPGSSCSVRASSAAEGAILGCYRFDKYKTKSTNHDISKYGKNKNKVNYPGQFSHPQLIVGLSVYLLN